MSATEKAEQELKDILIKVAKVRNIQNYDISIDATPSKTEGFLSELFTGVVNNNDNEETISVAIKMVPKQAGLFDNLADLYQNEETFYSRVFPELDRFQQGVEIPDKFDQIPAYFSGSLEPGKEFITMENIVAKGYRLTEKSSFLNKEHLELVFKVFGKFHALSFAFKDHNSNDYHNLVTNLIDIFKNISESDTLYESIVTNILAGLKVFDPEHDKAICEKLKKIENVKKAMATVNNYKGQYKCIIHGDCWSNNLLFTYGDSGIPEDVKFVDFQMIRESTPIHDLSFFFYAAASEEELGNLNSYLEIYYESFCGYAKLLGSDPKNLYPFEALQQDWKEYGLLGVFIGFDLLVLKLIKPEKALEMRNQEEIDKEEGLRMWDQEMARIRSTEEFRNRSRVLILYAIQHRLL